MSEQYPPSRWHLVWINLRRYLPLALVPLGVTVVAAAAFDYHGQSATPVGTYDAIVVAGCRVRPDGSPSIPLQRRTELAVRLYTEGYAPTLIVTGGLGDFPPSEALAAQKHAMALGVPETDIVVEDSSTSTEENAKLAAGRSGARRVLVVTDNYHVFRARRVFQRYFEEVDAVGVSSPLDTRARGALREVPAVAAYAVLGRL